MDLTIQFIFRNKLYSCIVCIDSSEYPCFVFVTLTDKELISEFGDDITIKTDCEKLLPKRDDYAELIELRQSIFDVTKMIPEFIAAKRKMKLLAK